MLRRLLTGGMPGRPAAGGAVRTGAGDAGVIATREGRAAAVVRRSAVDAPVDAVGPAGETADGTALVVLLDRSTAAGPVQAANMVATATIAPRTNVRMVVSDFTGEAYAALHRCEWVRGDPAAQLATVSGRMQDVGHDSDRTFGSRGLRRPGHREVGCVLRGAVRLGDRPQRRRLDEREDR